jgi:uncharacterized protein (DUF2236 family)
MADRGDVVSARSGIQAHSAMGKAETIMSSPVDVSPPEAAGVSHRVNAERIVLLAWSRAILLQLAHPLIAAGVYEHSSFRATPLTAVLRLRHTVRAMLAITFGDDAARTRAIDGIKAIHRRVHGHLLVDSGVFPAGTRYSAEDPDLVLWVHSTLVESVPVFYELLVAPLTVAERDVYCVEAAPAAVALGARQAEVPHSWTELHRYISGMYDSGRISVSAQARELATAVMAPPLAGVGVPAAWVNRALTVGLLPSFVREQYGFGWTPRDERTFTRVVRVLRLLRQMLPDVLATWPESRR